MKMIGFDLAIVFVVMPLVVWLVAWKLFLAEFFGRLVLVCCILFGVSIVTMFGRDGAGRHAVERTRNDYSQDQLFAWFDGAQSVFEEVIKYDPFYIAAYLGLAVVALLPSRPKRKENEPIFHSAMKGQTDGK